MDYLQFYAAALFVEKKVEKDNEMWVSNKAPALID
jgi:hypothetical protein